MNKKTVVVVINILLVSLAVGAQVVRTERLFDGQSNNNSRPSAQLPAALMGQAYVVKLSENSEPIAEAVDTLRPALHYAGLSATGRFKAYTALDTLDESEAEGRRSVTRIESNHSSRLVPSGDLYIENQSGSRAWKIDRPEDYVITAAWSPFNGNLIAYTFSSGSSFGVAIAHVRTGKVEVLRSEGILADYLAWSSEGIAVQFYEEVPGRSLKNIEGFNAPAFREVSIIIDTNRSSKLRTEIVSQLPEPAFVADMDVHEQPFYIPLGSSTVRGRNLAGVSELELLDAGGTVIKRLPAHAYVGILGSGMVYKSISERGTEISYLSPDGQVTTILTAKSLVQFKLPIHSGSSPDMIVTQVGNSYSTRCNVSSHTNNLSYAYDMQTTAGNEFILAAADGTIAYIERNINCNSRDTDCPDYSPTCSSGFGNTIIIQHADGTWTEYSHLRYNTIKPPSTGRAVYVGCDLAREGHTGQTCCNKNQCGDHLHFQRQSGSLPTSSSISIAFSDAANPLLCKSYESGNAGRSCQF